MTAITSTHAIRIDGASAQESERIVDAVGQLAGTTSGGHIAELLVEGRLSVEVLDDSVYSQRRTDSGADLVGLGGTIQVPRSALWQQHLVTLMAHEGHHTMEQARSGGRMIAAGGRIAGSMVDAARGAFELRNPITAYVDGLERRRHEEEVDAYTVQAAVAQELGYDESAWGLGQGPGGVLLSREEIRGRVAESPLHELSGEARTMQTLTFAAIMTSTLAPTSYLLTRHVAPKSQLAKNVMGHYTSAAVVTGLLLLFDSARRMPTAGNE